MEIHLNQQMHCVLTMEDIYHDQLWAPIAKQRCDYVWFAEHGGIERRIGLNISNEDEELHRVVELKKELMEKQKRVLILDGMRETFDIQKLGVPVQVKGYPQADSYKPIRKDLSMDDVSYLLCNNPSFITIQSHHWKTYPLWSQCPSAIPKYM